ncbi:hypothetical protein [Paenarthrobacter sp. FR1]|uniref:hypothetical protein n=1 Tax=Paenarthrobacter sp. FR1 TaxID=3439548 RepID=UPI003DA397F5
MNESNTERLTQLEAEAESLESSLLTKANSWALTQEAFVQDFLRTEARLTATNQPEITANLSAEIPALKAEIEEICRQVAATFANWRESADIETATALAKDPRKTFLELTRPAHDAFGDSFTRRGYDPGTTSRDWPGQTTSEWFFYIPKTGTARNPYMDYEHNSAHELSELWNSWSSISYALRTTKEKILRDQAAHLWDA